MPEPFPIPEPQGQDLVSPARLAPATWPAELGLAAVGASLALALGIAALGPAAGYLWSLLAPRATLVMLSPGAAGLVQVETNAFIAADAVFCLIALGGGVVSGVLGYRLAVRRHGPLAMTGLLAGSLAAAWLMRLTGEHLGLATFHHLLATLRPGQRLADSLTLGATSALVFWPLAAGLTAGFLAALSGRGAHGPRGSAGKHKRSID